MRSIIKGSLAGVAVATALALGAVGATTPADAAMHMGGGGHGGHGGGGFHGGGFHGGGFHGGGFHHGFGGRGFAGGYGRGYGGYGGYGWGGYPYYGGYYAYCDNPLWMLTPGYCAGRGVGDDAGYSRRRRQPRTSVFEPLKQ